MFTFSEIIKTKGSNAQRINVSKDGRPFGQIWTFKAAGEKHPWHFKGLSGSYQTFSTLKAAKEFAVR